MGWGREWEGSGLGGQGGCDRRGGSGEGGGDRGRVRVDVNKEFKFL